MYSTADAATEAIVDYLRQSRDVVQAAIEQPDFSATLVTIGDRVTTAIAAGGRCCSPATAEAPPTPST